MSVFSQERNPICITSIKRGGRPLPKLGREIKLDKRGKGKKDPPPPASKKKEKDATFFVIRRRIGPRTRHRGKRSYREERRRTVFCEKKREKRTFVLYYRKEIVHDFQRRKAKSGKKGGVPWPGSREEILFLSLGPREGAKEKKTAGGTGGGNFVRSEQTAFKILASGRGGRTARLSDEKGKSRQCAD